jgi:hypothetical protein
MMLRKIHAAKPSIQNSELLKHERKSQYLKKMVSDGNKGQNILQAARMMILSQELPKRLNKNRMQVTTRQSSRSKSRRFKSTKASNDGDKPNEVLSDIVAPCEMFDKKTLLANSPKESNQTMTMKALPENSNEITSSPKEKPPKSKRRGKKSIKAAMLNDKFQQCSTEGNQDRFRYMTNYNSFCDPNSLKGTLQKIKQWKHMIELSEKQHKLGAKKNSQR